MFAPRVAKTARNSGEHAPSRRAPGATRSSSADRAAGASWNLSSIQVGAVNDPLEHAANRAARHAVPSSHAAAASAPSPSAAIAPHSGVVDNVLRSSGRPLENGVRSFMESRLGHDFSRVRLHDDAAGIAAADSVDARAFTVGHHIGFSEAPNFSTPQGRHLLAHELAHVAQQATMSTPLLQRQPKQTPTQTQQTGAQQTGAQPTGPQLPQPIVTLLQQTSEGQGALNNLTTYRVTLILTNSGRPAFYDANGNTCTVNTALPAAVVASYFVHEMFHTLQEKTGKSGDAKKMDKPTFVGTMVSEEITGTVKGYQAYMELEQRGQVPPNATPPPRYESFKSAYKTGRERAQKANPTASEADLHQAGLKNAEAAIRWYVNEGGLGPFQGVTYAQYYGEEWKKAQKKP